MSNRETMGRETNCGELGVEISAWLDGELSAGRRRAVAEHLRDCAACRRRLEWLRVSRQAVRLTAPGAAPRGFDDRLADRLRAAPAGAGPWGRSFVPVLRLAAGLLAAAALLLLWAIRRDSVGETDAPSPAAVAPPIVAAEAMPPATLLRAPAVLPGPTAEALGLQRLGALPQWLACRLAGAGGSCRLEKACESPVECGPFPLEPVPLG